jgi:phosphopantothenoylcysteine decarboxylase/phosphopantothenate--cysteine ligase
VEVVEAPTAADLEREAVARRDADVVVLAAAVADYRPAAPVHGKRAKDGAPWLVELAPTADVAKALGEARANGQVLVAFGAETAERLERKRTMLDEKHVDLVVLNDVGRHDIGFEALQNEVLIVGRDGDVAVPRAPKPEVAARILDEVERLLTG